MVKAWILAMDDAKDVGTADRPAGPGKVLAGRSCNRERKSLECVVVTEPSGEFGVSPGELCDVDDAKCNSRSPNTCDKKLDLLGRLGTFNT